MTIADGSTALATDLLVSLTSAGIAFHLQHGLDAAKSATPAAGEVYIATDTGVVYMCAVANTWILVSGAISFDWTQVDCKAAGPTTAYTFTLLANTLKADRGMVVEVTGTFDIGGTARTPTVTFNFGASNVAITTALIPLNLAGAFRAWVFLANTAAGAQAYYMMVWFMSTGNTHYFREATGTFGVDTTANVTVSVQIGWSAGVTACNKERGAAHLQRVS